MELNSFVDKHYLSKTLPLLCKITLVSLRTATQHCIIPVICSKKERWKPKRMGWEMELCGEWASKKIVVCIAIARLLLIWSSGEKKMKTS